MSEPTKHIHNGVLTYGGNRVGHSSDLDAHREGRVGQHVTELAQVIDGILDEDAHTDGPPMPTAHEYPTPYAVQFAQRIIREMAKRRMP